MKYYECPKCQKSRWKTLIKNEKYECRKCNYVGNGNLKDKE